ncbi:MAG TPA: hypothetical protein VK025_02830 [Steroidobacter sp.]|jgi:hypothetical protein|nr:hypothetical protein [Steroidobacteraceae bacterium]HLS80318.1 hypothetical protein [Steroidobacter sp.]
MRTPDRKGADEESGEMNMALVRPTARGTLSAARKLLIGLCLGAALSAAANAGDDRRWDEKRSHAYSWSADHDRHRHAHARGGGKDHRRKAQDWRHRETRHPAVVQHRGRRCNDRRHHHAVHYHVAARDYYKYYYPRYSYYGPPPASLSASVIITLPLF